MARNAGKQKPKLGSIIAIPLPGKKFAFAKLFKDLTLGVYDLVSNKIEPVENVLKHKTSFFQAVVDTAIKSGKWPIIGEDPFPNEDAAWAPPKVTGVLIGKKVDPLKLRLVHKMTHRPVTPKEAAGLDIAFLSEDPDEFVEIVVDRLIKGQHEQYQVPG
jgi:hypothetical protein